MTPAEIVESVLAEHTASPRRNSLVAPLRCICGWESGVGAQGANRWRQHRAHLAAAVVEILEKVEEARMTPKQRIAAAEIKAGLW